MAKGSELPLELLPLSDWPAAEDMTRAERMAKIHDIQYQKNQYTERAMEIARQAGADPSLKLLPALLSEAVASFEEQLADDRHPLSAAERAALQRHRAACLATLGRKLDADAALAGHKAA